VVGSQGTGGSTCAARVGGTEPANQTGIHAQAWLGIPIVGFDFWEPQWKQNSDSVFDSGDSGRIFFETLMSGESGNQNSDLQYSEFQ
jgi:hypothetical protein